MANKKKKSTSASPQLLPNQEKKEELSLFWESVLISWQILGFFLFCYICYQAVLIRLFAVQTYGKVIHEFDPWFNFRATKYLVDNGYEQFVDWFDYESWYPMGRPIGTTVYPGMMLSTAFLYHLLEIFGFVVDLNDLCVFVPPFFSILTCCFTFLLAYEITKSQTGALVSMGLMALIPAHLMRSVAGGFDNESVAFFIIVATFYFWVRSLRDKNSWYYGIIAGLCYAYLACTWGAYVFVLNLVAFHGVIITIFGQFSHSVQLAYSCFYVVGTVGALQFPVVGWLPFDSTEQISGLVVFVLMQVGGIVLLLKRQLKLTTTQFQALVLVFSALFVVCVAAAVSHGLESGKLLPVTARVRGLFVKHTKTGNPLVDSVAEHRATPMHVFSTYFSFVYFFAPLGLLLSVFVFPYTAGTLFFWVYLVTSMYFSLKMIRLVVLLAPPACIAAGSILGMGIEWSFRVFSGTDQKRKKSADAPFIDVGGFFKNMRVIRLLIAALVVICCVFLLSNFYVHSWKIAPMLSEPHIMMRGTTRDGREVLIDDFRDGYTWLKENTPEDARVLSWWDYGYQINGLANRTTLADGNTWNHEHIALIGKILVSPERKAYMMARHLSDYILIWSGKWAGVMGDDLGKAPHMARIASSVYDDIAHADYYMESHTEPSPALSESLLYQLHQYKFNKDVGKPLYFEEVFTSKNRAMRIYEVLLPDQDSKEYISQHHTYPPALEGYLSGRRDFNRTGEGRFL